MDSRGVRRGVRKAPPIIQPADPKRNLLSFFNLVEAQVLASTRERKIGVRSVRRAIEYLREEGGEPRPLLNCIFETLGQQIFVQRLTGSRLKNPLNVSKHGQYAFKSILKKYLNRIDRDASGLPTQALPNEGGKTNAQQGDNHLPLRCVRKAINPEKRNKRRSNMASKERRRNREVSGSRLQTKTK